MRELTVIKKKGARPKIDVYRTLKKAIYSAYLHPGERLAETALADILKVSRTPVREALKRLEADNLVQKDSNKGLRVVQLSPVDIQELMHIAGILEGAAAELAIDGIGEDEISEFRMIQTKLEEAELNKEYEKWLTLNHQFHDVYLSHCNNTNLLRLLYEKSRPITRYWYYICSDPAILRTSFEEHEKIIRAFSQKDAKLTRDLVENHIVIVAYRLREHLENIPIL
jgi:DNA-binding GntR family transcriptional regulator